MNHYASHKTVIRRSHEPSNGRALNFIINYQHIINTPLTQCQCTGRIILKRWFLLESESEIVDCVAQNLSKFKTQLKIVINE